VHAFLWGHGELTDLGTLGGDSSVAYSINDSGQAAGWAENAEGQVRACLWEENGAADLGTLGGSRSMAYAINAAGQIVGYASTRSGVDHAFLAANGSGMVDLGSLGGYSVAYDVDRFGRVVGESATSAGAVHAFLWHDGEMIDLNDLLPPGSDWELVRAGVITDIGHVYGQGKLAGLERAFRMTIEDLQRTSH
jgi:probable HAF family extracellular repeat protein